MPRAIATNELTSEVCADFFASIAFSSFRTLASKGNEGKCRFDLWVLSEVFSKGVLVLEVQRGRQFGPLIIHVGNITYKFMMKLLK